MSANCSSVQPVIDSMSCVASKPARASIGRIRSASRSSMSILSARAFSGA